MRCRSRVEDAFKNIKVLKHITAPNDSNEMYEQIGDPSGFVYDTALLPTKPGRAYQPEVRHHKSENGLLNWDLVATQGKEINRFMLIRQRDYTEAEVMTFCTLFTDALNRWPDMTELTTAASKPKQAVRALFNAVIADGAFPHSTKPFRFSAPRPAVVPKTCFVDLTVPIINPNTFKGTEMGFRITHRQIATNIPEPENVVFGFGRSIMDYEGVRSDGTWRSQIEPDWDIDGSTRTALENTERFMRWFASVWAKRCPVVSESDAKAFFKAMVKKFGNERRALNTLYDGHSLFHSIIIREQLRRQIRATINVRNNVSGTIPNVMIDAVDFSWTQIVLEAGRTTWLATSDLEQTWMSIAEVADGVNRRIHAGEKSPGACNCSSTEATTAEHPCSSCGTLTLCNGLVLGTLGLPQCAICLRSPRLGERAVVAFLRSKWLSIRNNEQRKYDMGQNDDSMRKAVFAQIDIMLGSETRSEVTYCNTYSGKRLHFVPQMWHPRSPSIDAVFPFSLAPSGQVTIHSADNIAIVPTALNYGKHVHLPIFLAKLGEYYGRITTLEEGLRSGDTKATRDLESIQRPMLQECRRLRTIRMKVPYSKKGRCGLQMSAEQLSYLKEEWISGEFHPGNPEPWVGGLQQGRNRQFFKINKEDRWSELEIDSMLRIVDEIEAWTNVRLLRQNGCPYFAHPETLPSSWNWKQCQILLELRLCRMKQFCNKWWLTVDTAATLFLECIFQVSVNGMVFSSESPDFEEKAALRLKYSEFLRLPLHIEPHNPLTFAIGHRIHGHQMRTGWRASPTSLRDRIDNDNNILIETRTSNYLKFDYSEAHYAEIKAMLLDIELPLEIANPNLTLSPYNRELEQLKSAVHVDDDDWEEEDQNWEVWGIDGS